MFVAYSLNLELKSDGEDFDRLMKSYVKIKGRTKVENF